MTPLPLTRSQLLLHSSASSSYRCGSWAAAGNVLARASEKAPHSVSASLSTCESGALYCLALRTMSAKSLSRRSRVYPPPLSCSRIWARGMGRWML